MQQCFAGTPHACPSSCFYDDVLCLIFLCRRISEAQQLYLREDDGGDVESTHNV